jgi:NAD(P)H-hydrate repair Nnr-like enzyme with NAD(P)H-hydrate epimerase domain
MKTFVAFAAALTLVLAGCGGTELDSQKLEETLPKDLRAAVPSKIVAADCPSGIEVEKGKTFSCQVVLAEGKKETVKLRFLNEDADYEFVGLSSNK